ncbi:hypothetical protein BH18ACT15_BH18ACT15_07650 [soil metagenome]
MKSKRPARARSHHASRARLTTLLGAVVLLSVFAACSGNDGEGGGGNSGAPGGSSPAPGGSSAAALVLSSALVTKGEGSARVALTISTAAPGVPQGFDVTGHGSVDFDGGRGRLAFQVPNVFGEDQASSSSQSIVTVYDGSILYLGADFMSQIVPGGKRWLKVDAGKASGSLGPLAQLSQFGQSDPIAAFGLLEGLTGPVETIDEDVDVRGAPATHYRFTIDVGEALTKVSGVSRAQVEALDKQGIDAIPADVWLDAKGAVRRMQYRLDVPSAATGGGGKAKVAVRMELFDFGTPVDVEPPPADQVTDIGQLMGHEAAGE